MRDPFSIYDSKFGRGRSKPSLDWEETALQNAENPEDYYEGHATSSKSFIYYFLVSLVFVILLGRLVDMQLARGSYFRALADGNHVRIQPILPPRGIIFDSQGNPLVQNVPNFELVLTPVDLPKQDYQPEVKDLAAVMGFDPNALLSKIDPKQLDTFQTISVLQSVPKNLALTFEAQAEKYPGFSIEDNPIRSYLDPEVFSHLLGYTGKVTQIDVANHPDQYSPLDYIGKTGIEYTYEDYLKGLSGKKQVEVDAKGNYKATLATIEPQAGDSLVLNIDGELQQELYKNIIAKNGNHKAAAVALDPQTGQVLALISLPGFDNNLFSKGISQQDYSHLANDPNDPLINRAVSGIYPPGSTIKPVMASAALQENVVTPEQKIVDTGDLVYGNFHFRGWKPGGLGPMDIRTAIAMSSDIYFYTVGGGQSALGIAGLGPDRIAKYDYLFGMGQKLGIDIPGENSGLIASPQWRKEHFKDPKNQGWYLGDTYHESIGQGDMAVTPLQVASWTATVANGGTLYQPYIVNKVVDPSGAVVLQNQPKAIRSGFIDPKNIEIVREGMHQTVTAGTARSLSQLPISSAGKTGTAQFDSANPSAAHAWFTAFAPFDKPQIVITVLVEAGGEGSSASVPVVKDTLQWWAGHRYKK